MMMLAPTERQRQRDRDRETERENGCMILEKNERRGEELGFRFGSGVVGMKILVWGEG
jgi:hypothetical protein